MIKRLFVLLAVFGVLLSPLLSAQLYAQNTDAKNKKTEKKTNSKKDAGNKKAGNKKTQGFTSKEYSENDFRPKVKEESYGWMIFKTLLILGVMVGGFYYFFRFVTKKTGIQVMGEEVFQILSIVPIGQNKYLQVVDLAGKLLVLGVTDNMINVISEITDKAEIDRIRLLSSKSKTVEKESFQSIVMKHVGGFIDKVNEKRSVKKSESVKQHMESDVDLSYLKNQKSRLKKINGNDEH